MNTATGDRGSWVTGLKVWESLNSLPASLMSAKPSRLDRVDRERARGVRGRRKDVRKTAHLSHAVEVVHSG